MALEEACAEKSYCLTVWIAEKPDVSILDGKRLDGEKANLTGSSGQLVRSDDSKRRWLETRLRKARSMKITLLKIRSRSLGENKITNSTERFNQQHVSCLKMKALLVFGYLHGEND